MSAAKPRGTGVLPPLYSAPRPNATRTYGNGSPRVPEPPRNATTATASRRPQGDLRARESGWNADAHTSVLFSTFSKTKPVAPSIANSALLDSAVKDPNAAASAPVPRTTAILSMVPFAIGDATHVIGGAPAADATAVAVPGMSAPDYQRALNDAGGDPAKLEGLAPRLQYEFRVIENGWFTVRAVTEKPAAEGQESSGGAVASTLLWTARVGDGDRGDANAAASPTQQSPPVASLTSGTEYVVAPRHADGLCVAADGSGRIALVACAAAGDAAPRWRAEETADGAWRLVAADGTALALSDAPPADDDGNERHTVEARTADDADGSQQWRVKATAESKYFTIADGALGSVLTCRDAGTSAGTEVVAMGNGTDGARHQQFTFRPVAPSNGANNGNANKKSAPSTARSAAKPSKPAKGQPNTARTRGRAVPRSSSPRKATTPRKGVAAGPTTVCLSPPEGGAPPATQQWGLHAITSRTAPDGSRLYFFTSRAFPKMYLAFSETENADGTANVVLKPRPANDAGIGGMVLVRSKAAVVSAQQQTVRPAPPPKVETGIIVANKKIKRGRAVPSKNGKFKVQLRDDGNLVLIDTDAEAKAEEQKKQQQQQDAAEGSDHDAASTPKKNNADDDAASDGGYSSDGGQGYSDDEDARGSNASSTKPAKKKQAADDSSSKPTATSAPPKADGVDDAAPGVVWESKTTGKPAAHFMLTKQGCIEISDDAGAVLWTSPKVNCADAEAAVTDDGDLVVFDKRPREKVEKWRARMKPKPKPPAKQAPAPAPPPPAAASEHSSPPPSHRSDSPPPQSDGDASEHYSDDDDVASNGSEEERKRREEEEAAAAKDEEERKRREEEEAAAAKEEEERKRREEVEAAAAKEEEERKRREEEKAAAAAKEEEERKRREEEEAAAAKEEEERKRREEEEAAAAAKEEEERKRREEEKAAAAAKEEEERKRREEEEAAAAAEADKKPPRLRVGDKLLRGEVLESPDGKLTLVHQGDGNVVIYSKDADADGNRAVHFATNTVGASTTAFMLGEDGILKLIDENDGGAVRWSVGPFDGAQCFVLRDADSAGVVLDASRPAEDPANDSILWSTGKAREDEEAAAAAAAAAAKEEEERKRREEEEAAAAAAKEEEERKRREEEEAAAAAAAKEEEERTRREEEEAAAAKGEEERKRREEEEAAAAAAKEEEERKRREEEEAAAAAEADKKPPRLRVGEQLRRGRTLLSPDGELVMVHQDDGNVVIYSKESDADGNRAVHFATDTAGASTTAFMLGEDGTLKLIDENDGGAVRWSAGPFDGAQCFILRDDGFEGVLLDAPRPAEDPADDAILWSTRDAREEGATEFSANFFPDIEENDAVVLKVCACDAEDDGDGGRVLTVPDAATKAGTKVALLPNKGDDHQKWVPRDIGDGWWTFEPQHVSGAALACKGPDLPLIISVAKDGQQNQHWRFVKGADGNVLMENRAFLMTAELEDPAAAVPGATPKADPIYLCCRKHCGFAPRPHQCWRYVKVIITETVVTTTEESGSNVILVTGADLQEIKVRDGDAIGLIAEEGAGTVWTVLDAGEEGAVCLELNGKYLTAGETAGAPLVLLEPFPDDSEDGKRQQWSVDYGDEATFFSPVARPDEVMDVVDGVPVTALKADGRKEQEFNLTVVDPDEVKTTQNTEVTVDVQRA